MKRMSIKKITGIALVMIIFLAIIPFGDHDGIYYVDREDGLTKKEQVAGEGWLVWLYNNPVGKATLTTLVKRKFVSDWYGGQMDSPDSKSKVEPFIKDFHIDMSIAQKQDFSTFNEFFYRKLKPNARPINQDSLVVVSPADGKLLAVSNIQNQDFIVKGFKFNIADYFDKQALIDRYKDGSLMIIRLCPTDYHRYHFPIKGSVMEDAMINGDYYSVSPIALKKKIELLVMNKRSYCEIETLEFGHVVMSEVAATMVGTMINTYQGPQIEKGQERGYFKFGGSTVILFFEKDRIIIDADLLKNTAQGLETEVKMGTRIAIGVEIW